MEPNKGQGQTWQEWLAEQAAASTMVTSRIPLEAVQGWGMQDNGASFGRPDGKFFNLVGLRVSVPKPNQREVPSWDQPLIEEVGEAAVVLVRQWFDPNGPERVLLQARVEPGNHTPGHVMLGATLQGSRSNIEQVHGGSRPPRAELLDGRQVDWRQFPQDGGKYNGKVNAYAVLQLSIAEVGELRSNERWFSRTELREAMNAGQLNEHLLQVMALAFT